MWVLSTKLNLSSSICKISINVLLFFVVNVPIVAYQVAWIGFQLIIAQALPQLPASIAAAADAEQNPMNPA